MKKLLDKRFPWWSLGFLCLGLLTICFLVIGRQRADISQLNDTLRAVNMQRMSWQKEVSDRQHEKNIANTADYIIAHARENGYMREGEIRFVVRNPESLTQRETLDEVQVGIVVDGDPTAEAAAETAEPAAAEAVGPSEASEAAGMPAEEETQE